MSIDFGLALGGGGIKGFAHLALLKQLDQQHTPPTRIAGTSMGAILGALYARGLSGADIEQRVRTHLWTREDTLKAAYHKRSELFKWTKVFSFERAPGGMLSADGLFDHLFTELVDIDFEDLNIPFCAVATDYHNGEAVILDSGPLLPAVKASMAVPGVFAPIRLNGQLLVDGCLSHNVPHQHAITASGKVIASDVINLPTSPNPKSTELMSSALHIMICNATRRAFETLPPLCVFHPDTRGINTFDIHKISEVIDRGDTAMEPFLPTLRDALPP